jgi:hypothetical protein
MYLMLHVYLLPAGISEPPSSSANTLLSTRLSKHAGAILQSEPLQSLASPATPAAIAAAAAATAAATVGLGAGMDRKASDAPAPSSFTTASRSNAVIQCGSISTHLVQLSSSSTVEAGPGTERAPVIVLTDANGSTEQQTGSAAPGETAAATQEEEARTHKSGPLPILAAMAPVKRRSFASVPSLGRPIPAARALRPSADTLMLQLQHQHEQHLEHMKVGAGQKHAVYRYVLPEVQSSTHMLACPLTSTTGQHQT